MNDQKDAEKFVRAWMKAKKLGKTEIWIAEKMGVSRQAVNQKANRLQVAGIALPPLSPYESRLNIVKLNALIFQLND